MLPEDYDLLRVNWEKRQIFINPFSDRSTGQVILLNDKYNIESHEILINGRCQKLEMVYKDKHISLINVYAPNTDKYQIGFYRQLQEKLHSKESTDCLLLDGDFNLILSNDKDKLGENFITKRSRDILNELIQEENLVDSWRVQNPTKHKFTWSQKPHL